VRDFVIPESRYKNLLGTLQGTYGNTKNGNYMMETEEQRGNYTASLKNVFGYNSENSSYIMNTAIDGTLNTNTESSTYKYFVTPGVQKNTQTVENSHVSANGQYSFYMTPDEVYVYGSAAVAGSYNLNRRQVDTNGVYEQSIYDKSRTVGGSLGAGVGIGKMREASAVFSVVRIIEKLQEDGYLTRDLTKEEILEIVSIYARKIEYSTGYERPAKYFVDALLQRMEMLGVLREKHASAYETARIEEVFQEFIFPRLVGWTVQAGVTISRNQTESSGSNDYNYYPYSYEKFEQNCITLSAQYGYPFSLSLHWSTQATLAIPVFGGQMKVNQDVSSALYYQLGEKVSNELTMAYSRNSQYYVRTSWPDMSVTNNYFSIGNTVRYYVENNINFSVGILYTDTMGQSDVSLPTSRTTAGGIAVNFGMNYRIF
jgi:hypothetical protein